MMVCAVLSAACVASLGAADADLEQHFQQPPQSAKPRTWWHWVSGNVSSEGITADLQAMHDIGLGGCQLFTVDQSDVHGPVKFMSLEWRSFVKQALGEADKLGLEVSIEGCDGWSESGGPWIKPDQGMQHVVWSETNVVGGQEITIKLPQPAATGGFYRDIALLAFPELNDGGLRRIGDFDARIGMHPRFDIPFIHESLPAEQVIDPAKIVNLTGKKKWKAPPGRWTLVRIGHTGTGATTHPSTTPGLECDKLSAAAVRYHFEHMYGPILADSPAEAGRALHSFLLDSWECGCGNWTALMPKEFARRRGYDLTTWLPVFTGRVVKDCDSTQRFLWDFRRTIADLLTENHYGVARDFAHEHGMKLYAEAPGIGLPTVADNLACKGRTDIPMGEFWVNRSMEDNVDDPKEAASAAHIYGKPIVATESFTSTAEVASWANDPFGLKQLGDMEFCLGVNRFIFHRYAHQPWNDRVPGMSMGPWGINFERSNTWWKDGAAWIDYLARCQYLLQQGRFVADVLYFYGEGAAAGVEHRRLKPAPPGGDDYDVCNADIFLNQMSVDHGDIILKSGMRYRVLVLPDTDRMTAPVLKKVRWLVRAGATVYGPKPAMSPSLADNDAVVRKLAAEVWGNADGLKITSHVFGKGRVLWGESLAAALPAAPDFSASQLGMKFIHRRTSDGDIYFVSNQRKSPRTVNCSFRVTGKTPEFWYPDSGRIEKVALYDITNGITTMPIQFDPVGSVFVVFRNTAPADHAVAVSRDGKPLLVPDTKPTMEITKAVYGVAGDATKSRDVTAEAGQLVASGMDALPVGDFNKGGDPAKGIVKTLTVDYVVNGKSCTASAREGEDLLFKETWENRADAVKLWRDTHGVINLETAVPGNYEIMLSSGKKVSAIVPNVAVPSTIEGSWQLNFPPKLGAPPTAVFDQLMSWTDSTNTGVKYFSGTATYEKDINIPADYVDANRKLILDFGGVKNFAEVMLNGKSLGVLWKEPFTVDITEAARVGTNKLTIRITNLWPNRMIGDQNLPENERITWSSVHPYKADSPLLPSGLLGPVRLMPTQVVTLVP